MSLKCYLFLFSFLHLNNCEVGVYFIFFICGCIKIQCNDNIPKSLNPFYGVSFLFQFRFHRWVNAERIVILWCFLYLDALYRRIKKSQRAFFELQEVNCKWSFLPRACLIDNTYHCTFIDHNSHELILLQTKINEYLMRWNAFAPKFIA